jgi:hypothetical protein
MTAANENQKYYIENTGGNGAQAAGNPVPCIKAGSAFGAIRIADASGGMVLVGGGIGGAPLISGLRGGYADTTNGSQVRLGSSVASQSNIVLTDALTTINTSVNLAAVGADLTVNDQITLGGNLVFSAAGSISGYYNASVPSASYADSTDTPIANPVGLTAGWYIVAAATATGGQQEQQVSTMVHRSSGGLWDIGGSIRSVAGTGTFGFKPSADRTTLVVQNSSGAAQTATIYFAKVLN